MNLSKKALSAFLLFIICAVSVFAASCKNTVTVTYKFDTDGGQTIADISVEEGKEYTLPVPKKDGYGFEGWYTTPDHIGEPVESITAQQDLTFYAKWSKLYQIALQLNGGTLSSDKLHLKAGANVYDFMQSFIPEKKGLIFGAWFEGDNELSKNTRMTEAGITLSAKYKVEYTVEVWEESLTSDGYQKVAQDIKDYYYVDEEFTSEFERRGFREIEHVNAVTTLTLSPVAAENIFKHYFDREAYNLTYMPNYPDGSSGDSKSVSVKYGMELNVPYDYFAFDGYIFDGWATSANGAAEYKANYLDNIVYNRDSQGQPDLDSIKLERNTALYAVWKKGYVDMFGGHDYIFLLKDDAQTVYLSRGDVVFKGEYYSSSKTFIFRISENETLRGQLFSDGFYIYDSLARAELSATLYEVGVGLIDSTKIYFDKGHGITYSVTGEDGKTTQSEGAYIINNSGEYVATFTQGELSGKMLTIAMGTVTLNNITKPAFQVRNDSDIDLGRLVRFVVTEEYGLTYYTNAYDIILNGFGVATYNTGSSRSNYIYTIEDDAVVLYNTNGKMFLNIRLMEDDNGTKGYMPYESQLDRTYTSSSGASLTLDGLCNATLINGTDTITGYYTYKASVFGGNIVTVKSGSNTYKFLTATTTAEVSGDDGNTTVTNYSFEEKNIAYAEYYYADQGGIYYAPLIVINGDIAGSANIYGYTAAKTLEKVSSGTIVYNQATKRYTYTAEQYFPAEVSATIIDLSIIKSFVFSLDTEATSYNVNYWYSYTTTEGEQVINAKEYTAATGNGKLTLVSGFATYSAEGKVLTGSYTTESGLTIISTPAGYVFLQIDTDNDTFVELDHAPYTAYLLKADGNSTKDQYITFDGKGGAVYAVVTIGTDGEKVTTKYSGTIERFSDVVSGLYIYTFTSEHTEFDFIQLSTSADRLFAKYNDDYNGEYNSVTGGILTLDGFGNALTYIDSNGNVLKGRYFIPTENVICLIGSTGYVYFDIKADGSFTVRGSEYGSYILVDNQAVSGIVLELDGYGRLSVYKLDNDNQRIDIDIEALYTIDGKVFTLSYNDGAKNVTLIGQLSTMAISSRILNTFVIIRQDVVHTFVNQTDWSTLVLDSIGNATKYNIQGIKETGHYTLITDNLLYYVNAAATDAHIYEYDVQNGTATPIRFTHKSYFTKELESLIFSQYGFAIFNAETRYYYNIKNDIVTIYLQDAENAEANEYGFVAQDFGRFDDTKVWEGKAYFANSGFYIDFQRDQASSQKYPISVDGENITLKNLSFAPSGSMEFTVNGSVTVGDKVENCTVTRFINDEGEMETYVTVRGYRFYIKVDYSGDTGATSDNYYEVVALKRVYSVPSYAYLNTYYMLYAYFGASIASTYTNQIGVISITYIFGEDGLETSRYITGEFGEDSRMYDTDGNIVSFTDYNFSYDEEYGIYNAKFEASDGYTYHMYFTLAIHQAFGIPGYGLIAFTRVETLEANDQYTVIVERVIASDNSSIFPTGAYFSINLMKDGTAIDSDSIILLNGNLYYIVRTTDEDGKITQSAYYKIELTEEVGDGPIEDPNKVLVAKYVSAVVTCEQMTVIYAEDGQSYAEISQDGTVMQFYVSEKTYYVKESSYDEDSLTYTVTTTGNFTFTLKVEGGVLVVTEIVEQE